MKRLVKALRYFLLAVVIVATVLPISPVLATMTYTHMQQITITDTSSTNRTNLAIALPGIQGATLETAGYINSNGLNTSVKDNTTYTNTTYMMGSATSGIVVPALASSSSVTYNLYMGTNENQTGFPIITGDGGNVTVSDAAALEAGDTFKFTIEGYFNTETSAVGTYLINKTDAITLEVSATGELELNILGASPTTATFACPTGYHVLEVECDGVNIGIGFADNTLNDDAAVATVGTASAGNQAGTQAQNRVWYANGRYWVFYYNQLAAPNNSMWWYTSTDGISWASGGHFADGLGADDTDVWCDGTYFHVVYASVHVYYIRGLANADGSITWDAQQTALTSSGGYSSAYSIVCDSTGYPWIAARVDSGGNFKIIKSSTNNGTWTTDAAVTKTIGSASQRYSKLLALNNGNVYILYGTNTAVIGYEWKGAVTGWGAAETFVNAITNPYISGTIDRNNIIYAAWTTPADGIKLAHRHTDGAISASVTVQDTTTGSHSMGYLADMTKIYIVWGNYPLANKIYYRPYDITSDSLDATVTWQAEDFTIFANQWYICNKSRGGHLPVMWALDKATDEIRFSELKVDSPSEEVTLVAAVPDTANNWVLFDGTAVPYVASFQYEVSGTELIDYTPAQMITGTTVVNLDSAGAYPGTIAWGTASGVTITYGEVIGLPTIETVSATDITATQANLQGDLTSLSGEPEISCYFEYGLTTSYGLNTALIDKTTTGTFNATATGLHRNKTYHFRAVGYFGGFAVYGDDMTFSTLTATGASTDLDIPSVAIFSKYIETGDYLITVETICTYPPYYPSSKPGEYFMVQLYGTDNSTLIAAAPLANWGDMPTAIYINAAQGAGLTAQSAYKVRLTGYGITGTPSTTYTMTAADWKGSDLTRLDNWCLGVAASMQYFDERTDYLARRADNSYALSDTVAGYFYMGIPGIATQRPKLFATDSGSWTPDYGTADNSWDNIVNWPNYVGAAIQSDMTVFAVPFGVTGRDFFAGCIMAVIVGFILMITASAGFGALGAVFICIPILWLGTWFRIVNYSVIGIIAVIGVALWLRQFIVKTI